MSEAKIVQFVCFETILDSAPFLAQWEQYNRSNNSDLDVTMQQSEKNGVYRYIAQHRCSSGELQFVFTKGKASRIPQVQIKVKQAGGYAALQLERTHKAQASESKVFVFLANPQTNLDAYRQLKSYLKLNIYEAYYENCQYAYILEFFCKSREAEKLLPLLNALEEAETATYKEFSLS
jgi:hypothetical protein